VAAGVVEQRRQPSASVVLELLRSYDLVLVGAVVAMTSLGVVMVYSATRDKLATAGIDPHYYLIRQAAYAVVGFVVMVVLARIDYRWFEEVGLFGFAAMVVGLLAVLTPLGSSALGAARWIEVGPIQVQPSEFAAFFTIPFVAALLKRASSPPTLKQFLGIIAVVAVPMALVAKQPDLGSAIVMGVILLTCLAVGGARLRHLVLLGVVLVVVAWAAIHFDILKKFQLERLTSFLHQGSADRAANYNLTQAKTTIGSGGLSGYGLFRDPQTNLGYVPEQQTDFIFTAVGGQLGFIGAVSVLALYGLICQRIIRIARKAADRFGMVLCAGALGMLGFSVFEATGMTVGIVPITGIPLPFVAYGGSALLAAFAAMGMVLSVRAGSRRTLAP
jgi:rod shape determining protein RodA